MNPGQSRREIHPNKVRMYTKLTKTKELRISENVDCFGAFQGLFTWCDCDNALFLTPKGMLTLSESEKDQI